MNNHNHNTTNIDPIEPPKVSYIDMVKYRLGYFQGKSRVVTTIVGVALMSGVSLFVAYASLNNRNVSLNPENTTGAANPSCYLSLKLKTPMPLVYSSPTPTVFTCTNWGIDETSGVGSKIVKIDKTLSSVSLAKNYLCSSGYCEIESMDYDKNSKALYVVPNVAPTRGLYKVNTDANDNITDGTISLYKAFSPSFDVNGLSFKNSDPTKVWLWRNGYGLYTMNLSTGATTRVYAYTYYSNFESIEWDNEGKYLYASKGKELWRYDPLATTSKFVRYATNLPGKTDSMDFGSNLYLDGMLIGYNETNNSYYTYNVATKTVVKTYPNVGINADAFSACIPN